MPAWLVAPWLLAAATGAEPTCGSRDEVDQRVRTLVGPDAPHLGDADVRIEPTADQHYRVQVSVNTSRGTAVRQVDAASCELATNIAALLVAISLYPERSGEFEERAHPAAPPPADAIAPGERGTAGETKRRFALAATLLVDLTSMPSPAPGGGGTFGVRLGGRSWIEATVAAFVAQSVKVSEVRSAEFGMQSAAVRGCFAPWPTVPLAACAGAVGIRLAGSGSGSDHPHDATAWYVGPAAAAVASVSASGRLNLRASVEAFVPLVAHRFFLDGAEVHHPSAVGVVGQVGPEVSF